MFSFARFSWLPQVVFQCRGRCASLRTLSHCAILIALCCVPVQLYAEKMDLTESYAKGLTFDCEATVTSKGDVFFTQSEEKKNSEKLAASAQFRFQERRLLPAGRDALAFRAVRKFQLTNLKTTVGGHLTEVTLPSEASLILSEGFREGIRHYSPNSKLTRDSLDLLEIPGDPLVLAALLPLEEVEVDDEWEPSDWVAQMLTGVEAVESSELKCQLTAANSVSAKVKFSGEVKGQRFGANTTVDVEGTLIFDLRTSHVARTQAIYHIKSDVGTVDPGLDLVVSSNLSRTVSSGKSPFSDTFIESIPLDPPQDQLDLTFVAPAWRVKLEHGRDWHLYQAVIDAQEASANKIQPVAIFRLIEHGSLVCQVNFSPQGSSGTLIPIGQFASDIETSLGEKLKSIADQDESKTPDGVSIYKVTAEGEQEYKGVKGSVMIPMTWIYYLVTNTDGQQISFVFAVEKPLVEQLNGRDEQFVKGLMFTR